jgi:hypothetical protein
MDMKSAFLIATAIVAGSLIIAFVPSTRPEKELIEYRSDLASVKYLTGPGNETHETSGAKQGVILLEGGQFVLIKTYGKDDKTQSVLVPRERLIHFYAGGSWERIAVK